LDWKQKRCSKIFSLIAIFIFAACAFGAKKSENPTAQSQYDNEIKQRASALDSIRGELEKGREKLKELESKEGNFLSRLDQLEKNIGSSQSLLEILQKRIDTSETLIAALKDSLEFAGKKLGERQSIMKKRLRQAYMTGVPHPLFIIIAAGNPMDIVNRTRYIEELNRYDQGLLHDIDRSRREIDNRKHLHEQEKKKLTAMLDEKTKEQRSLVKEEAQRKEMLEEVRSQKKVYSAMVSELEESQKELNKIIQMLERKKKTARQKEKTGAKVTVTGFEKKKGKLPWPVDGPVVSKFGKMVHPVYKTVVMNNGIDIGSKKGQNVRCVASGTVIHVGWMRGLGKMVIVDHEEGFITIYAHLDDILVNQDEKVETGTLIGQTGDTGSIGGSGLHFEIRKSTQSLDPSEWLQ
jgi:septal ring factor EnvC (AmiA/AmiB activator)